MLMPEASVGNRRLYAWTPPADRPWVDLGPTLARPWVDPRSHLQPAIFHRKLRVGFKNIVFYGVSGPSTATAAILAMLKNVGFYVVLGSREGKKTEKNHLEGKNAQASANIGPKMGQHGANMGQPEAKIGQPRANIGRRWANMGPR